MRCVFHFLSTFVGLLLLLTIGLSLAEGDADADVETENDSEFGKVKVTVYEGPTECDVGEMVEFSNTVTFEYEGKIAESSATGTPGKVFESSKKIGKPAEFRVGLGGVIVGWDRGITGLCKGAKATLIVPPEMAFGDDGVGETIPPGATLSFDIEILDLKKEPMSERHSFDEADLDKDEYLTKEEFSKAFDTTGNLPDDLFEGWDSDGDGMLSFQEFHDINAKYEAPPAPEDYDGSMNPFDKFEELDYEAQLAMLKSFGLEDVSVEQFLESLKGQQYYADEL